MAPGRNGATGSARRSRRARKRPGAHASRGLGDSALAIANFKLCYTPALVRRSISARAPECVREGACAPRKFRYARFFEAPRESAAFAFVLYGWSEASQLSAAFAAS